MLLSALLLGLAGCATVAWYGQAARGQIEILAKREDIAQVMADPDTSPELEARLRTVLEIREFATRELGLPDSGSYRVYADLGREAPVWNVVAAPDLSVVPRTWCYPLVGCLAYRGFFRRERAQALASELAAEGYDVAVFPATAYSTLGWFDDPVLDSMLALEDADLAELIFHELTHERLFVRGETGFNEAYATFVGRLGAVRWLEDSGRRQALAEWRGKQAAERALVELLLAARRRLAEGFENAVDDADRAAVKAREYQRLREQINELAELHDAPMVQAWRDRELNNAHLALMATYEAGIAAFERLYRQACAEDLACVHRQASALAQSDGARRRAFLQDGH